MATKERKNKTMMYDNTILNQLNEKGFVVSKVKGVSMRPLLNQKNTSVYITNDETYKKNDCILYVRSDNSLILHRILKVKEDFYLVSGDNQSKLEKVFPNQVSGKLIEYYKHGKTKRLNGAKYRLYVFFMRLTRPVRYLRDVSKKAIKTIFRIK